MPPDGGVFLRETRRMHPDVCRFISDQIYRGASSVTRVVRSRAQRSAPVCGGWRPIMPIGPPNREEEAELVVAEISRLIGTTLDRPARAQRSARASGTSWWWLRTTTRCICCGPT